jgi:hypothetical protein
MASGTNSDGHVSREGITFTARLVIPVAKIRKLEEWSEHVIHAHPMHELG